MNENLSLNALPAEKLESLKQLTLIVYILQALGFMTVITSVVAIIVNYIKREETEGTIYASHFTWQIRTFWWSLLWGALSVPLMLIGVGVVTMAIDVIWVIYRLVKGILNWNDNKPMPV
ncbi:hypothetical protein OU995_26065 [Roseateles sp. SL47]|jgi:uncharacterized membrane protein|uniref:DUF4870 family protein n=1 Tax=Roseateles sp. SL47 TaxID=2995138 RepID=UPI00226D5E2E|nr:hypothetical protein [Roseateles sp. SL47]WAC72936.1 hypothetical protein OU995_26065 [Roseateles sp. SL47]